MVSKRKKLVATVTITICAAAFSMTNPGRGGAQPHIFKRGARRNRANLGRSRTARTKPAWLEHNSAQFGRKRPDNLLRNRWAATRPGEFYTFQSIPESNASGDQQGRFNRDYRVRSDTGVETR
jgi:hypothetical protein